MNRLDRGLFATQPLALDRPPAGPVAGLLFTCLEECFPSDVLLEELTPGAWVIQRTPGNIVPPYGAGRRDEDELIERAVHEFGIGTLAVCGHLPCAVAAHLESETAPDDFLLRDWLAHAEAARRHALAAPAARRAHTAAAHNVLVQLANLRTHPAVHAALAAGRLQLCGWLHVGGELRCPGAAAEFDRPAALQPDQNRYLRRRAVRGRHRLLPTPSPP
ncbi:MAG: hypothetical protein JNM56_30000, partial [Planctomycetia bacterium]|nr:hypothetical protein [Planctomycetia bacterium]